MVDIDILIRRSLYHHTDLDIAEYKERLESKRDKLKHTFEIREALANKWLIDAMIAALNREIEYCEFNESYSERLKTHLLEHPSEKLNEWVFTEKESITPVYSWDEPQGNEWTLTNGRIKATILIIKREKTTSIQLIYRNDTAAEWTKSNPLKFITETKSGKPKYLKKKESIEQHIKNLKLEAEAYLSEHMYPCYTPEITNLSALNKLLCIK